MIQGGDQLCANEIRCEKKTFLALVEKEGNANFREKNVCRLKN